MYSIIKDEDLVLRLGNAMLDEAGNRFIISMVMPSPIKISNEKEDIVTVALHSVSGKDLTENYLIYDSNSLYYYDAILTTESIAEDLHKEIDDLQKLSDELSEWPPT